MTSNNKYVLSVGEIAQRSGVPISTLHYYEGEGLIYATRTAGNQRRYAKEVLRRIGVIKAAQTVGIPLKEIKQALANLPQHKTPDANDWKDMAEQWKQDLNERIDRLFLLRDRLSGCIGCGCLSVDACPLFNPEDEQAKQGPGAQLLEPGSRKLNHNEFS